MAKYIDLLREHQNKNKAGKLSSGTPEAGDNTPPRKHEELETMLAEESVPASESETTTMPDSHELLAEEDAIDDFSTSPVSTGTLDINQTEAAFDIPAWLHHCCQEITNLLKQASANNIADIQPLTTQINHFLTELSAHPNIIDALELEISNQDKQINELDPDLGELIQKSVKMMLYGIKMGQRLQLNKDELSSYVLAAMIHNIGMAQIPSHIRHKKEKLTKDELKEISTASKKSLDYLGQCGVTDTVVLQAASQAQERFDGSGPQGLSGPDISYSARMTGLLSMFEALIHYRSYRERLLPRDAIRNIVNNYKKAFDPKMLKALIESISLYPVGTYVQLNSRDIGLVIQVHLRLPLRPVVRVMFDARGAPIPVREIDLKTQPNLMVQRCMYEETLAELKETADQGSH